VPHDQETRAEDLHLKFREACEDARETSMATSKWDDKLLTFIKMNATNWELEEIPTEFQPWIAKGVCLEDAQKVGKWIDLKSLMSPTVGDRYGVSSD
jgi:hypothetical protein